MCRIKSYTNNREDKGTNFSYLRNIFAYPFPTFVFIRYITQVSQAQLSQDTKERGDETTREKGEKENDRGKRLKWQEKKA